MAKKKKKQQLEHFSHKHPLTLVEADEEEDNNVETPEYRLFLRCYGCTEKISTGGGGPYYRCEQGCPLFCLHKSCAHLPMTIKHRHNNECDGYVHLMKYLRCESDTRCDMCGQPWYRFSYVCHDCGYLIDIRCAFDKHEAKHAFHQHPVYISFSPQADDLQCSACSLTICGDGDDPCYRCNYCNYSVHPGCTPVPIRRYHPSHPHELRLGVGFIGSNAICEICGEEIKRNKQWHYWCDECNSYRIHSIDCSSTIRFHL